MNRLFAAVVLILGLSGMAHALDPVTFETEYNWNTKSWLFTSVTSTVADVAGFGGRGYAIGGSTPNVVGFTYWILPVGSSATYTISQTTKTYGATAATTAGFNNQFPGNLYSANLAPAISTSSAITLPPGQTWRDAYQGRFQAQTMNPVFTFSSLNANATYWLVVEFGQAKRR